MTTDDHTCVRLLGDVVLRQVLAARGPGDADILLRLNLVHSGAVPAVRRYIGTSAGTTPTAADLARHPSAATARSVGRHYRADDAPSRHAA